MSAELTAIANDNWQLSGKLTNSSVPQMLAEGIAAIDACSSKQLAFDLGAVSESDSSSVALLIAWLRYALANNKLIVFNNCTKSMMDIISLSDLDEVLEIHSIS